MSRSFFAVAAPGLETIVADELRELGFDPRPEPGGVSFGGSWPDLYRANVRLRVASRVLVRLGAFRASAFWELHKQARRLPWADFLRPGQTVAIRATCHKSKLYHSNGVAERVANAIGEALGGAIQWGKSAEDDEAPEPPQLIVVRFDHDHCTIRLDSSGALLHRRGYRLATAKAPLRETLAAGVLRLSGWDRASPLIDPFCGSGTIGIEAALWAANRAPGSQRHFAMNHWPVAQGLSVSHQETPANTALPIIMLADRDAGAVAAARDNAARAGVNLEIRQQALSALAAPLGPGWIVTNPPYGQRVSQNHDLRNLYAQLGKIARARCPGWQVAFLCPDPALAHQTGFTFDLRQRPMLINGGVRVTLWKAKIGIG
jgi:putative N6-adenine-specific DNA methylase